MFLYKVCVLSLLFWTIDFLVIFQNKLRQLDDKQQELITDNLELKELCLYLDEERAHIAANALCVNCGASNRNTLRDDGDGSSSSTNADENITALRNYERQLPVSKQTSSVPINSYLPQNISTNAKNVIHKSNMRILFFSFYLVGSTFTFDTARSNIAICEIFGTTHSTVGGGTFDQ